MINQEELQKTADEILENNTKASSPVDYAAHWFSSYYPVFKKQIQNVGKKDLIKLVDALIAYPLEVTDPKFTSEHANGAFHLGNYLIECKMIMRNAVELENFLETENSEVDATETSPVLNETVTENGETNGKVE